MEKRRRGRGLRAPVQMEIRPASAQRTLIASAHAHEMCKEGAPHAQEASAGRGKVHGSTKPATAGEVRVPGRAARVGGFGCQAVRQGWGGSGARQGGKGTGGSGARRGGGGRRAASGRRGRQARARCEGDMGGRGATGGRGRVIAGKPGSCRGAGRKPRPETRRNKRGGRTRAETPVRRSRPHLERADVSFERRDRRPQSERGASPGLQGNLVRRGITRCRCGDGATGRTLPCGHHAGTPRRNAWIACATGLGAPQPDHLERARSS